jgi:hypothetical protein
VRRTSDPGRPYRSRASRFARAADVTWVTTFPKYIYIWVTTTIRIASTNTADAITFASAGIPRAAAM